jgi:DNA segregation ATPase FtsK/SpoIIIE, S-DNA-T family
MADPMNVEDVDPGSARIVNLARQRQRRQLAREGLSEAGQGDQETIDVVAEKVGPPVDAPAGPGVGLPAWLNGVTIEPVLPVWLTDEIARRELVAQAVRVVRFYVARHLVRLPLYAGRVTWYGARGAARVVGAVLGWTTAERGNWSLRQDAANRNDAGTWLALDKHRQSQASWRWLVTGAGTLASAALVAVGFTPLCPWWLATGAVMVGGSALVRYGKPVGATIVDRVSSGPQFVRLTADMVRRALVRVGAAKDESEVRFTQQIHRDGPGWLARVNLPEGVEAVSVVQRHGKLSSALRLPPDQVWPSVGPDHAGQLDLWVGYQPSSKMGQPRWSLATMSRTDVFKPVEFGTNARQRPITVTLMERNFLIGGRPGSGKSYGARTLALIAALDPRVELKIAEFKGTADFGDLAPYCSTYACGVDDVAFSTGSDIIAWGLAECERRGKRIRAARERGEAPHGKVTPELAGRPGSGLHPVLIFIDEAHELFGDDTYGKEAAQNAERLIKRGRALGMVVVICTQIPDKTSLPPNITRCVSTRWCMAVSDQVANDMILGTGAYKRGLSATGYRPGPDSGWGIATGLSADADGPVRSQFPSDEDTVRIIAAIAQVRGVAVVGSDSESGPVRDVLVDVLRVMPEAGRVQWQTLVGLLAERWPEVYGDWSAEAVSTTIRDRGVVGKQVKGPDGSNKQGCYADQIRKVIGDRFGG